VIVSDVLPLSPAEKAGLKAGDILVTVDGQPCDNLPTVAYYFLLRDSGDKVRIEVLRGKDLLTFDVPIMEEKHEIDARLALATPDKNLIPEIGILGIEVDRDVAKLMPGLRHSYGVITAAKTSSAPRDLLLVPGDVILAVNDFPTTTMESLRTGLKMLRPADPAVLQIEREGKLMYLSFSLQ
jgi:S1-C subfamily serine protease